jgi:hypothetical protein
MYRRFVIMRAPSFVRALPKLTSATLACVALLGGCQHEADPGSLVINYVLGNSKMCGELGIERLEVTVFQGSLEAPTVMFTDEELCTDDGDLSVVDIDPGVYSVAVTGFDSNYVAIFDNMGQPTAERTIEIFEGAQATLDANLTARPAELLIGWRLGEGGFSNCGAVGIDHFDIIAYEEGGGSVLIETSLDCDLAGDEMGFRAVPDPNRELNGTRFGEVGITARDASGAMVGEPAPFIFMPVGPGYQVKLRIECTETGCYEQP